MQLKKKKKEVRDKYIARRTTRPETKRFSTWSMWWSQRPSVCFAFQSYTLCPTFHGGVKITQVGSWPPIAFTSQQRDIYRCYSFCRKVCFGSHGLKKWLQSNKKKLRSNLTSTIHLCKFDIRAVCLFNWL